MDFIRSKGIDVQIEGNGRQDIHKKTFSSAAQSGERVQQPWAANAAPAEPTQAEPVKAEPAQAEPTQLKPAETESAKPASGKPEHMTHLRAGDLVTKTHPVIAYRGQLDLFQCELVEAQCFFLQEGEEELIRHLDEVAALCRQLMVSEVKQEPFQWTTLFGLTPEELRERSHHPQKYFGIDHTPLSYTHGPIVAKLHKLRSKSREVELYANRAFTDANGECSRTDLIQALNRLSSAFYILACQVRSRKAQELEEKRVPVGISNRHIHLSQADLEALFGKGYTLTSQKDLSQPGQFAAQETVALVGPKGRLDKVRVLGPVRKKTQAEISVTDCFSLGIKPVVRDSGQLDGTPGLQVVGPQGSVDLEVGAIVASRHIHLHTEDAKAWSLKDGDRVRVRVDSGRPIVYEDVLIRVSDQYRKEMHLDLDEANAALVGPTCRGLLMGV